MSHSNYHMHCYFCDGSGTPEEYVQKALSLGFDSIGFSSHAPVPFDNSWTMPESKAEEYCNIIKELKFKYKNQIQIYLGLEVDYIPGIIGPSSENIENLNLDYTIGSIHFIKNEATGAYLGIDGSEEEYQEIINAVFNGDVKSFVKHYYSLVVCMLKEHKPDIIGHFDIIKKNNRNSRYFSEEDQWYKDIVNYTLEQIAGFNAILEVNTGGLSRGYIDSFYPSEWILEECKRLGIRITLNSDAHSPENLNAFFASALSALKRIGYSEQQVLKNGQWINTELK